MNYMYIQLFYEINRSSKTCKSLHRIGILKLIGHNNPNFGRLKLALNVQHLNKFRYCLLVLFSQRNLLFVGS
jgi:hypothetical protein